MAQPILATNLRYIRKNTLLASVDLTIVGWKLSIHGCLWHRHPNGQEWIGFPGREWVGTDGRKAFAVLLKFNDPEVHQRFQTAALSAVHALAGEAAA